MKAPAAPAPAPLLRRLRYTPFRDLFRGRTTSRLDLARRVDHAGLPPRADERVRQTVRATRLWRPEKVSVADELIAHFRDGRDAGHTDDELAEAFGNPAVAAKLIGRAKRRNRSWSARGFVWSRRVAMVLVLLYAGLAAQFFVGSPRVTVDYIAQLNAAALAVPEDQRAWPGLRAAWIEAREKDDGDYPGPAYFDPDPATLDVRDPADPAWPQANAFLERQRPRLDAIHRGAAMPRLGFVAKPDHDLSVADRRAFGMDPAGESALDANARRTVERAEGRRDGLRIGIALQRYRLAHGRWPGRLAELTPDLLPTLPVDRVTGGPLRYRVGDDGPVVYSLGGNRDDDRGRPANQENDEADPDRAAYWSEPTTGHDGDGLIYAASAE